MSKHHTIGGKGRAAIDRPPKPKLASLIIGCSLCGAEYNTVTNVGAFDIHKVCDCGALIHLTGRYDGMYVELYSGTVEEAIP